MRIIKHAQVIPSKYLDSEEGSSTIWRCINSNIEKIPQGLKREIEDAMKISFWKDSWRIHVVRKIEDIKALEGNSWTNVITIINYIQPIKWNQGGLE